MLNIRLTSNIDSAITKIEWRMYFLHQLYTAVIQPVLCSSITVWFGLNTKQDRHQDNCGPWIQPVSTSPFRRRYRALCNKTTRLRLRLRSHIHKNSSVENLPLVCFYSMSEGANKTFNSRDKAVQLWGTCNHNHNKNPKWTTNQKTEFCLPHILHCPHSALAGTNTWEFG